MLRLSAVIERTPCGFALMAIRHVTVSEGLGAPELRNRTWSCTKTCTQCVYACTHKTNVIAISKSNYNGVLHSHNGDIVLYVACIFIGATVVLLLVHTKHIC